MTVVWHSEISVAIVPLWLETTSVLSFWKLKNEESVTSEIHLPNYPVGMHQFHVKKKKKIITKRTAEMRFFFLVFFSDVVRQIIWAMKLFNRLKPNDPYMGRTAPLTSKRCILYIYSTNIGTEYFRHALYSPFFSLQNAVCFIMLTCLVPALFTFYIQSVLKFKKIIPAPKG